VGNVHIKKNPMEAIICCGGTVYALQAC
jgi:hypothetical protein